MDPLTFLRAHPPFDRLGDAALRRIEDGLRIEYHARGSRLLTQGGPQSRSLSIVRKGVVHLERDGHLVQVIEEGEGFGFPSLISKGPPVASAVCAEDVLLYQVPEAIFHELMALPAWSEFFLLDLAERLRRSTAPAPLPLGRDLSLPARQVAREPIVRVGPDCTVGEAARRMRDSRASCAIVGGGGGSPGDEGAGILTDRDLRSKVLAEGRGPETRVGEVASRPLQALPADVSLFEALVFMLERRLHHVPLTDGDNIVGMITDMDVLRLSGRSPLGVLAGFAEGDGPKVVDGYGQEIRATVEQLAAGGLEAAKIGRIVARLNDGLCARLITAAERELGPPPSPYAFIVFGSEGRMEQALLTDQDNALIFSDEALANGGSGDGYFRALGERVVEGLVRAGVPPCPGGYMATRWCHPLSAFVERFRAYLATPSAEALLESSILFDFRRVHGTLDLEPLEALLRAAPDHPVFLMHLARTALSFEPPLSPLRRIQGGERGVDLKRGGLAPIVGLARLYALAAGSPARSTLARLAAAEEARTLSRQGAATLAEAFRFLLGLRLRAQLRAVSGGRPPDNFLQLDDLPPLERSHLKDTFLAIRELQQATALTFSTDRLG